MPEVLYAEPNYHQHAVATLPDDPMFSNLWGLNNTGQTGGTPDADIDAPEAWEFSTGSSDVVICVIDTGVTYTHPDLSANMWTNAAELGGVPGVDDDGNGYIDDIYGINAIDGSGNPMDDNGHGTHCSGTIAAVGNNGLGVAGVNWTAGVMGCKFLDSGGGGWTDDAIECVQYATTMGAKVMSNSWGGGGFSQALGDAIESANAAGILFIAAAGNYGSDNDAWPFYPASYDNANLIAVAATDHYDGMVSFSNFGLTSVDVGAPGVDIFSTFLPGAYLSDTCNDMDGDGYGLCSGTSMACPHVAGLSALAMSAFPSANHLEIKTRILGSVDPLPSLAGRVFTGGRINAFRTLTEPVFGPHIYYITPTAGAAGDTATIVGSVFGSSQGAGVVTFYNGQNAPVTSWSDVEIVCQVPEGAETGEVTVTTDEGVSNGVLFTVIVPYYNERLVPHEIEGDGTAMDWHADDACWLHALPFNFPYFDTSYDAVYVCSNGFLDFTNGYPDYGNYDEGLRKRAMIAPLWDDLRTDGAGEDIFIHQPSAKTLAFRWVGRTYSIGNPVEVEVVFYQDGGIQFNYGEGNVDLTPTIGISKGDGLYYHLSLHNNQPVLTNADSDFYAPVSLVCSDGDGDEYGYPASSGCPHPQEDCDDSNPAVNPGVTEGPHGDPICSDSMDNDCDGAVDLDDPGCVPCNDSDGDGYGDPASENCAHPQRDCDDTNYAVNPGAIESPPGDPICSDTLDNDCDGDVDLDDSGCDECVDNDGDGYGDPESSACTHPEQDCDDSDPDVNPGAAEICTGGIDEDCDNLIDSADPDCKVEWGTANAEASIYGPRSLTASGSFNALALLLIPVGAVIVLRILRRRK